MDEARRQPSTLDLVPEAVLVLDAALSVSDASPVAARMLEVADAAALRGRAIVDLLAPGEAPRLLALLEQQRAGWPAPVSFRVRFAPEGGGGEILTDARVTRRDGLVVISARDITEQTRGERLIGRLAEISARVGTSGSDEDLLDACGPIFRELGWIVAYSAVRGEETTVLRVLGPQEDPLVAYGRSILGKALGPAEAPIAAEIIRSRRGLFLDNLPSLSPEEDRKDARELDRHMREARVRRSAWCPVFRGDDLTHLLSVGGEDLTAHDFVALQLFAAQLGAAARSAALRGELVRTERLIAMGKMSAVLAHEIRNPLAVIFNAVSGLKRAPLPEGPRQLVEIVDEEAQRLRSVVGEILDFSREPKPVVTDVDVAEAVESAGAAATSDPAARDAKSSLQMILPASLPPARADRELLRRALVNLVVNALCHATEGSAVRVSAAATPDAVEISVWNAGEPIPRERGAKLFEPFYTTRSEGTGLGLFVALRSVEACGGEIRIDEVSDGAQFTVALRRSG